ncbi:dTMP kinase [Chiayiivirga flava]|uniref:Thymidylate kinase n=1 Tax=Chiayiivirga flava TaxID=659595 RepID=A0A7W8D7M7_9GAMM|nr:dTMP kinase [Chiayiivirga flava]
MSDGKLITLEGGEGAGKSTAMACIANRLCARGIELVQVREPGGTPAGEAIRALVLDPAHRGLHAQAELLLMFAARAQLVHAVIEPALARGAWVLGDRFTDASFAYQGGGRGLDAGFIAELERRVVARKPDLTLLLDLPVRDGLARARGRGDSDRIETEAEQFFERVRAAYRQRAALEPARWRVVDASQPLDGVLGDLARELDAFVDSVR